MSEPLLDAQDLTVRHGQLVALHEVSLQVSAGEVFAVVGANGAGKSTLLRTLAGLHPTHGRIRFAGEDITRESAHARVRHGIAMVPEGRRLFRSLTLEENIRIGQVNARAGSWDVAACYDLFGWMHARRHERVSHLSGGEQQQVAIARALVANPRLLLLDEVSLGLAPVIVQQIYRVLPTLLEQGISMLLVEQDVSQALRVANRFQCLLEGRTTLQGTPEQYTVHDVEAAYFGFTAEDAS
ncbi:MAG TPA: ABC transporter ATP-binding protein [Jatrophihabitantaceae bacterium]|jgi:branched-chain amino acid transport system ATP-binding protein|nr:ABC transporter ATP-binding protein [Jatrophihabitantaceae bacterium]